MEIAIYMLWLLNVAVVGYIANKKGYDGVMYAFWSIVAPLPTLLIILFLPKRSNDGE